MGGTILDAEHTSVFREEDRIRWMGKGVPESLESSGASFMAEGSFGWEEIFDPGRC
jgi:hypothetical protein